MWFQCFCSMLVLESWIDLHFFPRAKVQTLWVSTEVLELPLRANKPTCCRTLWCTSMWTAKGKRKSIYITWSYAPIITTSHIFRIFGWKIFCIQIPRQLFEEVNHWISAVSSPSAWWVMPAGLDPCLQLDPPQQQAWGKAGMKISLRTYGTTWCINCKCQEQVTMHFHLSL